MKELGGHRDQSIANYYNRKTNLITRDNVKETIFISKVIKMQLVLLNPRKKST